MQGIEFDQYDFAAGPNRRGDLGQMLQQLTDKHNRISEFLANSLMHSYEMPEDDRYSNTARIDMAEEDALR